MAPIEIDSSVQASKVARKDRIPNGAPGCDQSPAVSSSESKKGLETGDMVWGKIASHTWWPGYIFNEDFEVSDYAKETKKKGHVLIAFFGDNSFGWLLPAHILPFDQNFTSKSKQTLLVKDFGEKMVKDFVTAIKESVEEVSRRAALGLTCYCRNPYNFWSAKITGYLTVDVPGYEDGAVYLPRQIIRAREDFALKKTLSFLQVAALDNLTLKFPMIDQIKGIAVLLSFRQTRYEEFDETYAQAFGKKPIRPPPKARPIQGVQPSIFALQAAPLISNRPELSEPPRHKKSSKSSSSSSSSSSSATARAEQKRQPSSSMLGIKAEQISDIGGDQSPVVTPQPAVSVPGVTKKMKRHMGEANRKEDIIEEEEEEKKKQKMESAAETSSPTAICIKFSPESTLPSFNELRAKFARFGKVEANKIRIYENSSTCKVVFQYKREAEAAISHAIKNKMFGQNKVSYSLQDVAPPPVAAMSSSVIQQQQELSTVDSSSFRSGTSGDHGLLVPEGSSRQARPHTPSLLPQKQPSGVLKSIMKQPPQHHSGSDSNGSERRVPQHLQPPPARVPSSMSHVPFSSALSASIPPPPLPVSFSIPSLSLPSAFSTPIPPPPLPVSFSIYPVSFSSAFSAPIPPPPPPLPSNISHMSFSSTLSVPIPPPPPPMVPISISPVQFPSTLSVPILPPPSEAAGAGRANLRDPRIQQQQQQMKEQTGDEGEGKAAPPVDPKDKMMKLLLRCNDILGNIKSTLGYLPLHEL